MKKRMFFLILALVFALTLVSCTSAPTEEGGEVPTPDVQENEESEAEDLVEVWVYVRQTDPKGNVTTVTYNDFGQPEQKKQNDPHGVGGTDPTARVGARPPVNKKQRKSRTTCGFF